MIVAVTQFGDQTYTFSHICEINGISKGKCSKLLQTKWIIEWVGHSFSIWTHRCSSFEYKISSFLVLLIISFNLSNYRLNEWTSDSFSSSLAFTNLNAIFRWFGFNETLKRGDYKWHRDDVDTLKLAQFCDILMTISSKFPKPATFYG